MKRPFASGNRRSRSQTKDGQINHNLIVSVIICGGARIVRGVLDPAALLTYLPYLPIMGDPFFVLDQTPVLTVPGTTHRSYT